MSGCPQKHSGLYCLWFAESKKYGGLQLLFAAGRAADGRETAGPAIADGAEDAGRLIFLVVSAEGGGATWGKSMSAVTAAGIRSVSRRSALAGPSAPAPAELQGLRADLLLPADAQDWRAPS